MSQKPRKESLEEGCSNEHCHKTLEECHRATDITVTSTSAGLSSGRQTAR